MKKGLVLFFATLTFLTTAYAIDFKKVNFPDEVKLGTSTLKLNGIGIRKILVLHVYYGALYVEKPTTDSKAILDSTTPKQIIMHFKRWVEKSKIADTWEESFSNNKEAGYDWKPDFKKLKDALVHMNENDRIVIDFYSDRAEIKVKDAAPLKIDGANFSKTLLKVFIGQALDPDFKKGLLNPVK